MTAMNVTALVLAGTRAGEADTVARAAGTSCKAFADIDGTPMIERVLDALQSSGRIGQVAVCLAADLPVAHEAPGLAALLADGTVLRIDPDRSPARSVGRALAQLPGAGPVLVTTADHALLTPAMIAALLDGFDPGRFDIGVGIVRLDVLLARYPALKRTKLRFKDGGVKGCNLFLLNDSAAGQRLIAFWQRIESLRKQPLRMARALGPVTLLRYALGLLTLDDAFRRIGMLTGTRVQPIMINDANAAIDVDSPADLAFVRSRVRAA